MQTALAGLLASSALAGCMSHESYSIALQPLAEAQALASDARAHAAIPAIRLHDGHAVYLSGTRIDATTTSPVTIVAPSRLVKAGVILTLVGTAISLAGSGLYFFGAGRTRLAGEILAPGAEPLMISGTILWIVGALRPPGELGTGHTGVHYLER